MTIKERLIAAGVRNLKKYGYPQCNKHNVLTDIIFKSFFAEMLKANRGRDEERDEAIDELLLVVCK